MMGIGEAIVLPVIFIIAGLLTEKKISKSLKDNGRCPVARIFAFVYIAAVLLLVFVLPNPIMNDLLRDEYPWLGFCKAAFYVGMCLQTIFRVLNEIALRKVVNNEA